MSASGAIAAAPVFERILLPVAVRAPINGAFGSVWTTTITILNAADRPVDIRGYDWAPAGCGIPECGGPPPTPSGVTFFPKPLPSPLPGSLLYVDSTAAADVHVGLRLQDLSRQSETWGTEVPVVREKDMYVTTFELLDVPLTDGFRQILRLYNVNAVGTPVAHARVRFYRVDPAVYSLTDPFGPRPPADPLLLEETVTFAVNNGLGYAEIPNIAAMSSLMGSSRVRIEIIPVEPNVLLWGFVSVTNNATQHATLITPH